jgi:hypothetical protein
VVDERGVIGAWQRAGSFADDLYPDRLVFSEKGLYRGEKDELGMFTLWDVGTYDLVSDGEVAISTANDAVVRYRYVLDGDHLTFADVTGTESWAYERVRADRPDDCPGEPGERTES